MNKSFDWRNKWSNGEKISLRDRQWMTPDYLNSQLPRSIHGWHSFSEDHQNWFKEKEKELILKENWELQPDGSFFPKDKTIVS